MLENHPVSAGAASRKLHESMLPKSEKMLSAILESVSEAIFTVDRRGRIVLANASAERMFGYTQEELLGSGIESLLPQGSRDVHAQRRQEYFAEPRNRPMGIGLDLAGRRKDGSEFPVEVSLSYLQIEGELFAIAFVTDITTRKQMEEQLLHSQKMEALGRLAGGVAHDFNNMLTIITGYNQMVLDQLPPADPLRGYIEEVLTAANRAVALTNQLLAFSRRQVLQPRVLNVNALLSGTEKMLRRLIGEDIDLVFRLDPKAGNVRADPGQIEQVIFNLVVNSRDAIQAGGRISIETAPAHLDTGYSRTHLGVRPGEYVLIAVSDTGHGMDAETKRHIFEPFFTTKEPGKGTGLGLATVYGIVKQSGGEIWVYSEPGQGTTFKVYFPRVDEAVSPPEAFTTVDERRGTETVLVVEDEEGVRELIAEMLRQRGYTVLTAENGVEALRVSAEHTGPIHLLVTDVVMPQMSGKQLADTLVSLRPDIKVLYLSGYTEYSMVHHGVLEPGFQFLGKPFSRETLVRKIREVLDAPTEE
ncbi:MAG TPA: PAS domain S-box protein [Bryobacteraceae bacterium]|nr:PAS domain S-box protein [Bryobacteraceae bacterium]HOQ44802.1 PAS domain S-box protein [Bryobacteraceae bacterium]HPU73569.1 PAS domain S-box protein [Bryobacteraceae bacterium]